MTLTLCYDQRGTQGLSHTSPLTFAWCALVLSCLTQTATPCEQVLEEKVGDNEGDCKRTSDMASITP